MKTLTKSEMIALIYKLQEESETIGENWEWQDIDHRRAFVLALKRQREIRKKLIEEIESMGE